MEACCCQVVQLFTNHYKLEIPHKKAKSSRTFHFWNANIKVLGIIQCPTVKLLKSIEFLQDF